MMVKRPIVLAVLCLGAFLILQALLPKTTALNPDIGRYMMEDRRTHRRKNYMIQRERHKDFMANPEGVITYETEPLDPDRNPDELSAFIVDYANMIRDDVILLDKSVETRTSERGNIKVKRCKTDDNVVMKNPPCTCNGTIAFIPMGDNVYPKYIPVNNCSGSSCVDPYACKEIHYDLPILRRSLVRRTSEEKENDEFPHDYWYAATKRISVGCMCLGDWTKKNKEIV